LSRSGRVVRFSSFEAQRAETRRVEEARANLEEAVGLVLEANRMLAREDTTGADVIREPFKLTA